jgi:transposase InsO family protein
VTRARKRVLSKERQDMTRHNPTILDEQQEYMRWHYKLNHASQKVMTRMANKDMLPSYITRILKTMDKQCRKGPICNDCYSASAARTPWRTKPNKQMKQTEDRRANLSPGDVVSVDQLETSTPGFIGQITEILTRQRIVGSTIFVDQASDMGYVYHHLSMSSEETVKAKESFERYAKSYGVNIKHYHADNGRFKDKAFMKSIEDSGQTISFSGVGAHHQNGIAEKRIGDLQRRATTLLLHAQRRWPDAITTHLWPYALRAANDSRNNTPTAKSNECPMSRFCRTARVPKLRHQHHFGCPVYVLSKDMQDGKKARKWEDRTRVGINLGYSPRHAHTVS